MVIQKTMAQHVLGRNESRHRTMNGAAFEPPHPWRPEGLRYIGRAREGFALSEGRSGRAGGTHKRLPSEIVIGTRCGQGLSLTLLFLRHQFVNDPQAGVESTSTTNEAT